MDQQELPAGLSLLDELYAPDTKEPPLPLCQLCGEGGAVAASAAQQGHFPTPVVTGLSVLVLTALCLLLSKFLRHRR
ncbi:hypothetical protein ACFRCI_49345 [Streptomyces sp. NPDC056638]|uniref:hypothetical protein n=1 Tax=Streptomyces sp. NPDC056638 TaxID=3345887 RepID=UPI00367A8431